jgi:hypothetical protein
VTQTGGAGVFGARMDFALACDACCSGWSLFIASSFVRSWAGPREDGRGSALADGGAAWSASGVAAFPSGGGAVLRLPFCGFDSSLSNRGLAVVALLLLAGGAFSLSASGAVAARAARVSRVDNMSAGNEDGDRRTAGARREQQRGVRLTDFTACCDAAVWTTPL